MAVQNMQMVQVFPVRKALQKGSIPYNSHNSILNGSKSKILWFSESLERYLSNDVF